jgi:molybdopterin converting factor small subunit
MITILVPGALRKEAGGEGQLRVEDAATLGDVLDTVASRWPLLHRRIRDEQGQIRRYVNVFVDGEDCRHVGGLQTPVRDGTEVQVIPSVAGG